MRTRRHLSALALVASFTVCAHAAPPKIIPDITSSADVGAGPVAAPDGGLLAKAARCAAIPESAALSDECQHASAGGAFAVSADDATYLFFGPESRSSCGGGDKVTIERTSVVKGKLAAAEAVFTHLGCEAEGVEDPEACLVAQTRAVWKALAKLATDGFRDLPDLAGARMDGEAGIQSAQPVVVLGAPLTGWMLYLKDEGHRSKILLVDPKNEKAFAIGHRVCSEYAPYPDAPEDEYVSDCFGSVEHVSLTADRKALILSTSYHDGGHCSSHELATTRYWLPKKVQALLAPPSAATPAPMKRDAAP
ncbi:MAG: hypothetical protein IV100_26720 [Myxococcales bacterium]|nr:hypothetical protein [Myxococcales bacterium]